MTSSPRAKVEGFDKASRDPSTGARRIGNLSAISSAAPSLFSLVSVPMHAPADFFARPCAARRQIRLPQRFCFSPGAYSGVSRQPLFCPGSPAFANWFGVARNFHALQTIDAVLKYISRVFCLVFYGFQEWPEKRQREESQCSSFIFSAGSSSFPALVEA